MRSMSNSPPPAQGRHAFPTFSIQHGGERDSFDIYSPTDGFMAPPAAHNKAEADVPRPALRNSISSSSSTSISSNNNKIGEINIIAENAIGMDHNSKSNISQSDIVNNDDGSNNNNNNNNNDNNNDHKYVTKCVNAEEPRNTSTTGDSPPLVLWLPTSAQESLTQMGLAAAAAAAGGAAPSSALKDSNNTSSLQGSSFTVSEEHMNILLRQISRIEPLETLVMRQAASITQLQAQVEQLMTGSRRESAAESINEVNRYEMEESAPSRPYSAFSFRGDENSNGNTLTSANNTINNIGNSNNNKRLVQRSVTVPILTTPRPPCSHICKQLPTSSIYNTPHPRAFTNSMSVFTIPENIASVVPSSNAQTGEARLDDDSESGSPPGPPRRTASGSFCEGMTLASVSLKLTQEIARVMLDVTNMTARMENCEKALQRETQKRRDLGKATWGEFKKVASSMQQLRRHYKYFATVAYRMHYTNNRDFNDSGALMSTAEFVDDGSGGGDGMPRRRAASSTTTNSKHSSSSGNSQNDQSPNNNINNTARNSMTRNIRQRLASITRIPPSIGHTDGRSATQNTTTFYSPVAPVPPMYPNIALTNHNSYSKSAAAASRRYHVSGDGSVQSTSHYRYESQPSFNCPSGSARRPTTGSEGFATTQQLPPHVTHSAQMGTPSSRRVQTATDVLHRGHSRSSASNNSEYCFPEMTISSLVSSQPNVTNSQDSNSSNQPRCATAITVPHHEVYLTRSAVSANNNNNNNNNNTCSVCHREETSSIVGILKSSSSTLSAMSSSKLNRSKPTPLSAETLQGAVVSELPSIVTDALKGDGSSGAECPLSTLPGTPTPERGLGLHSPSEPTAGTAIYSAHSSRGVVEEDSDGNATCHTDTTKATNDNTRVVILDPSLNRQLTEVMLDNTAIDNDIPSNRTSIPE